jgi:hypothetical protein
MLITGTPRYIWPTLVYTYLPLLCCTSYSKTWWYGLPSQLPLELNVRAKRVHTYVLTNVYPINQWWVLISEREPTKLIINEHSWFCQDWSINESLWDHGFIPVLMNNNGLHQGGRREDWGLATRKKRGLRTGSVFFLGSISGDHP